MDDDDRFEDWFAQGELLEVSETAPADQMSDRRSLAGIIIAAVSAAALTLVLVFAGRA